MLPQMSAQMCSLLSSRQKNSLSCLFRPFGSVTSQLSQPGHCAGGFVPALKGKVTHLRVWAQVTDSAPTTTTDLQVDPGKTDPTGAASPHTSQPGPASHPHPMGQTQHPLHNELPTRSEPGEGQTLKNIWNGGVPFVVKEDNGRVHTASSYHCHPSSSSFSKYYVPGTV